MENEEEYEKLDVEDEKLDVEASELDAEAPLECECDGGIITTFLKNFKYRI